MPGSIYTDDCEVVLATCPCNFTEVIGSGGYTTRDIYEGIQTSGDYFQRETDLFFTPNGLFILSAYYGMETSDGIPASGVCELNPLPDSPEEEIYIRLYSIAETEACRQELYALEETCYVRVGSESEVACDDSYFDTFGS